MAYLGALNYGGTAISGAQVVVEVRPPPVVIDVLPLELTPGQQFTWTGTITQATGNYVVLIHVEAECVGRVPVSMRWEVKKNGTQLINDVTPHDYTPWAEFSCLQSCQTRDTVQLTVQNMSMSESLFVKRGQVALVNA
jgi:hypothetical protein